MGLFDCVRCKYPLPGNPPDNLDEFQTKDLECSMHQYVITSDGELVGERAEDYATCTVDLYFSNIVSSGAGVYTSNGDDAHSGNYRVTFVAGKVFSVEQTKNVREPALPVSQRKTWHFNERSPEEIAARDAREKESLIGREMFLQYGGSAKGYSVQIIAENSRYYVAQSEREEINKLYRSDRDRLLFDNAADSEAYTASRNKAWTDEQVEYQRKLAIYMAGKV